MKIKPSIKTITVKNLINVLLILAIMLLLITGFNFRSLSEDERKVMMNPPAIGYAMLKHFRRDILVAAGVIAFQHHEKWDGSGYPQGLAGEDVHIFARITALADVFDALYSPRVYKEMWPIEEVRAWISGQSGKHFDPQRVSIF